MSAPSGATAYIFDNVSFYRLVTGEYAPWFVAKKEYTQKLVLDSDQDYLDQGATAYEPLSVRAVVFSEASRLTLLGKLGTTAVLNNARGRSQDATLVSAFAVDLGLAGYFAADLTFIRRPTGASA